VVKMNTSLKRIQSIIGYSDDMVYAERLEQLRKADAIEYISLRPLETARRRLRVNTSKGRECAIALPRNVDLRDGAILLLEENLAIVVQLQERKWLRLKPKNQAAALELGYHCGNLHWKVEFDHPELRIAIEGEESSYLARISNFLEDNRVYKVEE